MRFVAAIIVLAVALPTALVVHRHTVGMPGYDPTAYGPGAGASVTYQVRPSWDDPAALAIAIVGVGTASMLLMRRRTPLERPR